jgi:salicylate hydroxylase
LELICPEIAQAYDKVKTPNLWPEKDHIWFDFRYGDGPKAGEFITDLATKNGFIHSGASRAHFLDELVKLIPETVKVVFGKKVKDVVKADESGGMKVVFEDGEAVEVDAAIGCDGIRSVCRRVLLGDDDVTARAVYSGKYAYRKVVSMEKAVEAAGNEIENRTIYVGKGGHILVFPIQNGKALNMVVFKDAEGKPWTDKQWVLLSSRESILNDFKGWGDKAVRLLEVCNHFVPSPEYAKAGCNINTEY